VATYVNLAVPGTSHQLILFVSGTDRSRVFPVIALPCRFTSAVDWLDSPDLKPADPFFEEFSPYEVK